MESKKKIWKMLKFKQTKNKDNKKKIKIRIRIKILKIMNKVVNMMGNKRLMIRNLAYQIEN